MNKQANNNSYTMSFVWILILFIIMASMAYSNIAVAKSVQDYDKRVSLDKMQQNLDFPVLEHWDAGNGEDAIWVNPDQSLNSINLPQVSFDTPNYKLHLNVEQPQMNMINPSRIYKSVAKMELFAWD
jgi:hypothetical protein